MTTSRVNTLDLITCQICFDEYDGETKKPKFLPCSHTICLECFQTLRRGNTIMCPFCRTHTRFNNYSIGVEWILPTNQYVLELLRMNQTDCTNELNSMPSTAPFREPGEEVDEQLTLAQPTQEQVIPTAAAILQPTNEDEELRRFVLEISGRDIVVQEILNEARRQSLWNQQQRGWPTLRDLDRLDGLREPQGNTVAGAPAIQHTTVPYLNRTNEEIFFMLLFGQFGSLVLCYGYLLFCQLFTFFWTRSQFLLGIAFLLGNSAIDSFRVNLYTIFFCFILSYDIFYLLLELSMFFFQSLETLEMVVGNCISVVFV